MNSRLHDSELPPPSVAPRHAAPAQLHTLALTVARAVQTPSHQLPITWWKKAVQSLADQLLPGLKRAPLAKKVGVPDTPRAQPSFQLMRVRSSLLPWFMALMNEEAGMFTPDDWEASLPKAAMTSVMLMPAVAPLPNCSWAENTASIHAKGLDEAVRPTMVAPSAARYELWWYGSGKRCIVNATDAGSELSSALLRAGHAACECNWEWPRRGVGRGQQWVATCATARDNLKMARDAPRRRATARPEKQKA